MLRSAELSSSSVCLSKAASSAVKLSGQKLPALTLQSPSCEQLLYAAGPCHIVTADARSAMSEIHAAAAAAPPSPSSVTVRSHSFDFV